MQHEQQLSELRLLHRQREGWMRATIRLGNQIGAACRAVASAGQRSKAATELERAIRKEFKSGVFPDVSADPTAAYVAPLWEAEQLVAGRCKAAQRSMEELARELPSASFVERTKGFGYFGLAQILGEAGHLCNYPVPTALWRRFGVGADQVGKADRSKRRRTVLYRIVEPLAIRLKQKAATSKRAAREDSPYRKHYDYRKVVEQENAALQGIPIVTQAKATAARKKGETVLSVKQVHLRALRSAERELLADLLTAYKKECSCVSARDCAHVSNLHDGADSQLYVNQ